MWDMVFGKKPEQKILAKLGFKNTAGLNESFELKAVIVKKKIGKRGGFLVSSADENTTKYLIEHSLVDAVLCSSTLDQASAKIASENRIAVVFSFNEILKTKGLARSKALNKMRHNARLAIKYKCPVIFCSGAQNDEELVSASDLMGFAEYLGFSRGSAKEGLNKVYEKILEREK